MLKIILDKIVWELKNTLIGCLAVIILAGGLGVAIYVAGWVLFVGGVTDLINLLKSSAPVTSVNVAIAILMIISALPVLLAITYIVIRVWSPIDSILDARVHDPWSEDQWIDGHWVKNPNRQRIVTFKKYSKYIFLFIVIVFYLALYLSIYISKNN
jgi:hypothetical protein